MSKFTNTLIFFNLPFFLVCKVICSKVSPHVLVISHDVVGSRMAGPGIRAWELAHVLAAHQPVTLIAPQPIDRPSTTVTCGSYTWGNALSLAPWLQAADAVIANGFMLLGHPELADLLQPLALDLYDPTLLENLEVLRGASPDQRATQSRQDIALLQQQLGAGDFFVCATERQRDLYLGSLMATGRITADVAAADPDLRALIGVVPTGLPHTPPAHRRSMVRSVVPGIGMEDVVIVWSGGLWDWMDPLTLIAAMPTVAARHPCVRLVFLAGQHPGAIQAMAMPDRARAAAHASGLLDRHIFFYDQWVPYDERADVLLEADLAVYLHRPHLETRYAAVRSRMLDHLWAGLPSVVSAGDAAADLVERHDLGRVIPSATPDAVADALLALLNDPARRARCAHNARQLAQQFTWQHTAAPLIQFCQHPTARRPRLNAAQSAAQPGAPSLPDGQPNAMTNEHSTLIQRMERTWQFGVLPPRGGLRGLVQRVAIRLLGPLIAQQREFNAAAVQLAYQQVEPTAAVPPDSVAQAPLNAVLAQVLSTQHAMNALQNDVNTLHNAVHALHAELPQRHAAIEAKLAALQAAEQQIAEHAALFREIGERLGNVDTLQARIQELAYVHHRVSGMNDTLQLLNDAVAEHDRIQAELAEHVAQLTLHTNAAGLADG